MNLVFLIAIVVEDFSDQRTPHQLRVSMFDLKPEENAKDRRSKGYDGDSKIARCCCKFSKAYQKAVSKTSTSDQQMSQERLCVQVF